MTSIRAFCDEADNVTQLYTDYSGRAMFGRECVGIVVSGNMMNVFGYLILHLQENGHEHTINRMLESGIRTDNMGLDSIMYFPSLQWGDNEDEDEDEEEEDGDEEEDEEEDDGVR